jgi:hypothetical protein
MTHLDKNTWHWCVEASIAAVIHVSCRSICLAANLRQQLTHSLWFSFPLHRLYIYARFHTSALLLEAYRTLNQSVDPTRYITHARSKQLQDSTVHFFHVAVAIPFSHGQGTRVGYLGRLSSSGYRTADLSNERHKVRTHMHVRPPPSSSSWLHNQLHLSLPRSHSYQKIRYETVTCHGKIYAITRGLTHNK